MSDYLDINNEELLKDFFSEAEQQVETLESNILVIENDPSNHEAIDEIFRAAHTLKGGSATVEMHELSGFTHAMEDLLDVLRSGAVKVTEPVVDVLLASLDVIKAMLDARQKGSVYKEDVTGLKARLEAMIPAKEAKSKSAAPKKAPVAASPVAAARPAPAANANVPVEDAQGLLSEYEILELRESVPSGSNVYVVRVTFDESNPMNTVGGIQVFASLKQSGQVLKTMPDFDALYEDQFHEQVTYFVASTEDSAKITKAATISDVTLNVSVSIFNLKAEPARASAAPASQPAAKPAPVAAATVEKAESPVSAPSSSETSAAVGAAEASDDSALTAEISESKKAAPSAVHASSGSVLRVDSRRIDYLLNLVSETVITKASFNQSAMQFTDLGSQFQQCENQYKEKLRKLLDHIPEYLEQMQGGYNAKDLKKDLNAEYSELFELFGDFETSMKGTVTKFRSAAQNLGRITGELQEGVMKIRMVPISQIFSRFPRLVRDLSRDLNKKVQLVIEGEETELDKAVIEDLLDPIMHCVRNALDHGIETPDVRAKMGKSEEGNRHRDRRRRTWYRRGRRKAQGRQPGHHPSRQEPHRRGSLPAHIRAGVLHRRKNHERIRPRSWPRRRENPYRKAERYRYDHLATWRRFPLYHSPAAYPGDHPGLADSRRQGSVFHSDHLGYRKPSG